jgi:hypothetical protein
MRKTPLPPFALMMGLLLQLATLSVQASTPDVPDLAARIQYQDRTTSADGVIRESSWQERWQRRGDQIWSERLIPITVARAYHQQHDGQPGHKHFTHQMAARWVGRDEDGTVQLHYADRYHKQLVSVPPEEYGQVAFTPNWAKVRFLIDPELLATMDLLEDAAPAGARWYEHKTAHERTRILWSARLQVPLQVESGSLDGYRSYKMTLTPAKLSAQAPWLALTDYQPRDIRDFFD